MAKCPTISNANCPVDHHGACFDRDMWYTYGHNKSYRNGHMIAFGRECTDVDCPGHMTAEEVEGIQQFTCDTCSVIWEMR